MLDVLHKTDSRSPSPQRVAVRKAEDDPRKPNPKNLTTDGEDCPDHITTHARAEERCDFSGEECEISTRIHECIKLDDAAIPLHLDGQHRTEDRSRADDVPTVRDRHDLSDEETIRDPLEDWPRFPEPAGCRSHDPQRLTRGDDLTPSSIPGNPLPAIPRRNDGAAECCGHSVSIREIGTMSPPSLATRTASGSTDLTHLPKKLRRCETPERTPRGARGVSANLQVEFLRAGGVHPAGLHRDGFCLRMVP